MGISCLLLGVRACGLSRRNAVHDGRRSGVACDELVGDRVEVVADVVRLWADVQRCVALAKDEGGLPAGRDGTEGVPDVARDEADVAGIETERARDRLVRLWCG